MSEINGIIAKPEKETRREIHKGIRDEFGVSVLLRPYCLINGHSNVQDHFGKASCGDPEYWRANCCRICGRIDFIKRAASWNAPSAAAKAA